MRKSTPAIRLATPSPLLDAKRNLRRRQPRPPWVLRGESPPETDVSSEETALLRTVVDWQVATWYRRCWPQMTAFVLPSSSDAHMRVNLQGRERDGIVLVDGYEDACREVEEVVRSCRNPRTGGPAVRQIIRMRPDDPLDPDGPNADLVIMWNGTVDALEHPEIGVVAPFPFSRTGEHSSHGFASCPGRVSLPAIWASDRRSTCPRRFWPSWD